MDSSSSNSTTTKTCEKDGKFSLCCSLFAVWLFGSKGILLPPREKAMLRILKAQKTQLSSSVERSIRYFRQGFCALAARVDAVASSKFNVRTLIGLGMVLYVAPFSENLYTYFEHKNHDLSWYYETWHWFWMCLGPYMFNAFSWTGAYFLFCPPGFNKKSFVFAVPIGYSVAKILWLLTVQNHTEFRSVPPALFYLYGVGIASLTLISFQYIEYRTHHRTRKYKAHLDGLC